MKSKKIIIPLLATMLCASCNVTSGSEEVDYEKLYGKHITEK